MQLLLLLSLCQTQTLPKEHRPSVTGMFFLLAFGVYVCTILKHKYFNNIQRKNIYSSVPRHQKIGLSTLSTQRKSKPVPSRSSSSCPRPSAVSAQSGSPRMPLRVLFGTRRSLSSTHCRTDSPSPQRVCPSRQPLSVRAPTVPVLPPRTTTTMRRSASQEATAQSSSGTMPARTRPKPTTPAKGKPNAREKSVPAR